MCTMHVLIYLIPIIIVYLFFFFLGGGGSKFTVSVILYFVLTC